MIRADARSTPHLSRSLATLGVALVFAVAASACSSSDSSAPTQPIVAQEPTEAASGTTSSGIHAGYPTDTDVISPLLISALAPEPSAILGTDGRYHLVYELQVINASPRPATLTGVETIEGGVTGEVVAALGGEELVERTMIVGDTTGATTHEIPAGRVALILLDGVYATEAEVPDAVTHRISATFASSPDDDRVTTFYPTEATQFGGEVTTSSTPPITVGPPIGGDGWITIGSCCTLPGHRGFMMPMGGRMNGTERYGLDLIRLDLTADVLLDPETGDIASYNGDPNLNESYLAWGMPALAVADATVVDVKSHVSSHAPGGMSEGLDINETTGNFVVLDLGNGVRAMSNHLQQDSPTVKVGDKVTKGQVIGRVGNAGNTTQPHLHFQLYRGLTPLSGDNVPFVIDSFTYVGQATATGVATPTAPGPRTNQYPLVESITNYPAG